MYGHNVIYKYGQNKGGLDNMSPKGRPTKDKRNKRFEIRLSDTTYCTLENCAKSLGITKAEVIHKGINLVKKEIDEKK
jgi:hypothetical protein